MLSAHTMAHSLSSRVNMTFFRIKYMITISQILLFLTGSFSTYILDQFVHSSGKVLRFHSNSFRIQAEGFITQFGIRKPNMIDISFFIFCNRNLSWKFLNKDSTDAEFALVYVRNAYTGSL